MGTNTYQPEVPISKGEYVLPLLERMGVRIPRDLAFVNLFLEDTKGATAGVRQNHQLVGATAVGILAGQVQHNKCGLPDVSTTTFVEGTWFDGATCPMPGRGSGPSEPGLVRDDNVRSRTSKTKS